MNSINHHKIISIFILRTLSISLLHALPGFILSGTKRNVWEAVVGMDIPNLVDYCKKTCFLGKRHSLEATCSVLSFILRYPATRRHRTERYMTMFSISIWATPVPAPITFRRHPRGTGMACDQSLYPVPGIPEKIVIKCCLMLAYSFTDRWC